MKKPNIEKDEYSLQSELMKTSQLFFRRVGQVKGTKDHSSIATTVMSMRKVKNLYKQEFKQRPFRYVKSRTLIHEVKNSFIFFVRLTASVKITRLNAESFRMPTKRTVGRNKYNRVTDGQPTKRQQKVSLISIPKSPTESSNPARIHIKELDNA